MSYQFRHGTYPLLLCVVFTVALSIMSSIPTLAQQSDDPDDPYYERQWALSMIGASCAWQASIGSEQVTVAVLDSGIDLQHPDLAAQIRQDGYDFVDDDNDPSDENGHGTHVSGIIAATLDNAEGISGLAPNVKILPVRVGDEEGVIADRSVAAGIRYAVEQGAQVINLSLGMTFMGDESSISQDVDAAIREAQQNDVLLVIAAGNDFLPLPNAVASNNPDVMVVAASNEIDELTEFSNIGPWVDVSAPGQAILSTMPTYTVYLTSSALPRRERFEQDYDYMSGTSQATPYVSALAALLLSAHPDWSTDQVQEVIKRTASTDIYQSQPDIYQRLNLLGAGRIDACAALSESPPTAQPQAPRASPTASARTGPSDDETLQIVREFLDALQAGDLERANALIAPDRPGQMVDLQAYLDLFPQLKQMQNLEYEILESSGNQTRVLVRYQTDDPAREEHTIIFTITRIDSTWYIHDFAFSSLR
jgi:type VII secretion-associated serine protease mycosin